MDKKYIWIGLAVLLLLLGIGLGLYFYLRPSEESSTASSAPAPASSTPASSTPASSTPASSTPASSSTPTTPAAPVTIARCSATGSFPETKVGEKATGPCPTGQTGQVTATCNADGTFSLPDTSQCVTPNATVYVDVNFSGRSWSFPPGSYDFDQVNGNIGNDTISSAKVPAGCTLTLYEHAGFGGNTKVITADNEWISDFNDAASSLKFTCG